MRQVLQFLALLFSGFPKSSAMQILIFGGNGFIGSHVSERLLDRGHRLTLINRSGKFAWNTADTIGSRIDTVFRCDRYNPSFCDDDFWSRLDEASSKFDAVIDFSAYRLNTFLPFYDRLSKSKKRSDGGNRLLYVYISTDSIYEVCQKSDNRLAKEIDAVRPIDEGEREKLAKFDSYGDRKLQIEEYLIDQRRNHDGLPYAILRLPDVLGERDSTDRFWKYQLWLRYGKSIDRPVQIPRFARSLSTSYVDAKDVASMIESILENRSKSEDQIFNVAFDQQIDLIDLLTKMQLYSEAPPESISTSSKNEKDKEETLSYFPSVTRGGLDTSKAKNDLGWRPETDWSRSVERICKFYLDAENRFEKELMETAHGLMRDLGLNEEERKKFLEAIRQRNSGDEGPSSAKKTKTKDEF